MKQGWQLEKLGDVCAFLNRGISPRYLEQGGICVLNQKCIRNHHVSYDQSRRHDVAVKSVGEDRFLQLGDVLVNSTGTGTLGRVAQIREKPPEPTTVDSHVTIVRPKPNKFFPEFFGYMLVLIEEAIKEAGEGCGGQTELARSVLAEKFLVSYPTLLSEQQRIVAILDEAFAAIAKAKASAEQNLKNAKELFESYLQSVFENKGEGWEEKSVADFVNEGKLFKPLDGNHGEIHPLKHDYVDVGIPFIMSRDLNDGIVDEKNCKFITEKQARGLRTGFAVKGDVLLSHKGTIGSVAILDTNYEFVMLTPQITYYRVKDQNSFYNKFLYYQLLSPGFQKAINSIAEGGSTRAYIGITKQLSLKLKIAPLKAQQSIVQKLDVLSAETKKLEAIYQQKINDLEELKKSILQKAFSGELNTSTEVSL